MAPGGIVLGGGLAEAGPLLVGPLTRHMQAAGRPFEVPPLSTAAFGRNAGVVGAALLALDADGSSR